LNENEQLHNIFKDWLEIKILPDVQSIPYILGITWGALLGASSGFGILILPLMYNGLL